jgi:hypothetical protein
MEEMGEGLGCGWTLFLEALGLGFWWGSGRERKEVSERWMGDVCVVLEG